MTKVPTKLFILLPLTVFCCCCHLIAQTKSDFLRSYDIFYIDKAGDLTRNGEKVEKGGIEFSPDVLYSDGAFLSSFAELASHDVQRTSTDLNNFKLFFQGKVYESYYGPDNVLRDGNIIYYVKCEKKEYINAAKGNCCVKTAIYANDSKIDEADITSDILARTGWSNVNPLFMQNGILYYSKTVGEKTNFYSYDSTLQTTSLFKPELFSNNYKELLGILDNGDIIFSDSVGIYSNNLDSKIIDRNRLESEVSGWYKGVAVGNHYYYFVHDTGDGHGMIEDNLLVANIRSDSYGRTIDAEEQGCHFDNFIYGYLTVMQCVNRQGTIVRMDKRTNKPTPHVGRPPYEESDVVYYVDKDVVDFSRYWKIGRDLFEEGIKNLSFFFDEKGKVSFIVVTALEENKMLPDIYLVRYLGAGRLSKPEILFREATLFGVTKKSNNQ